MIYVAKWYGSVFVVFTNDVFAKIIVGWRVYTLLRTDQAPETLEQALWARGEIDALFNQSDRGSPFPSIRYYVRLAESGIEFLEGRVANSPAINSPGQ